MNIKALIKSLLLRRFTTGLLVLQLALTLSLAVNSWVMALDVNKQLARELGFAKDELLVVSLLPTSGAFRDEAFYLSVLHQDIAMLEQLPGVKSVSQMVQLPIQRGGWNGSVHDVSDESILQTNRMLNYVPFYFSNHAIFDTLGLELLEGRLYDANSPQAEEQETQDVVITESLAKAIYGEQSAVGQELNFGNVIGVVSDFVTMPGLDPEKQYAVFAHRDLAIADLPQNYMIRADASQHQALANQVSERLLKLNPERDILKVFTMNQHQSDFYQQDTGLVGLFVMLCVLMLIVTAISSFAHAQFHISKQKRLIGIRRALGATRQDIILYVLSENWLVTLLGCLLGIGVVVAINVGLSTQIEISKPNSLLYLGAIVVVFVSGTLATWLPALRTSSIPPVIATRTV